MRKFLITLAALTVIATPAFAQAFDPDIGTGNVPSFAHRPTAPQNDKITVRRNGFSGFAMVPRTSASNPNDPTLTGGGSLGYNEILLNY